MNTNWPLLSKYIAGECSPEEEQEVIDWIEEDEENYQQYRLLCDIWEVDPGDQVSFDAEKAWDAFEENKLPGKTEEEQKRYPANVGSGFEKAKTRYLWSTSLTAAAATILILICVYVFLPMDTQFGDEVSVEEPSSKMISTGMGERTTLRLADGTLVYLNAGSSIEIPTTYGDSLRRVNLTGEAFFEVVDNAQKPFIVRSDDIKTRVVGTKFNVAAYPCEAGLPTCDREVQVVVEEGEVELGMATQEHGNSIRRLQKGTVGSSGKTIVEDVSSLSAYISWKDGQLVFDSTSFDEVLIRLEHWYDLDIQMDDSSLASRKLTASFENDPLSEVLDVIALSLDANYVKEGRRVTFSSKQ